MKRDNVKIIAIGVLSCAAFFILQRTLNSLLNK